MHPKTQEFSHLILLIQEDGDPSWMILQKFNNGLAAFFRVYPKDRQPSGLILGG